MHTGPERPHRVAAVAFDGMAPFELGVVVEAFGLPRPELGVRWYELSVCSPDPAPLRMVGGLTATPSATLRALARADTIVVPAWPRIGQEVPAPLIRALQRSHHRGARLVSICSGAFVLAATGLLDGRRAATHWRYARRLRELHPRVMVDERVLYVDDGELLTSAGSAAGIDLCLHIIRRDHGSAIANQVARRFVVSPHREGGQAQFIERPMQLEDQDRLRVAMEWALANLDQPIALDQLAAQAAMSARSCSRHFQRSVGMSPMAWLTAQRVQASRVLLEEGELPVEWVAARCGFPTASAFRQHFRKAVGVSPSDYRRQFAVERAGRPD